jgi:predicted AlkP superfamily phosphohydrolase/phosphomutase
MKKPILILIALAVLRLLAPSPALAYIGPGAGFAFLSSFLFVVGAGAVVFLLIFTLPFRLMLRALRRKKKHGKASVDRLVILGLDGLDPTLAAGFMERGLLPHLSALKESGTFRPLGTSNPPISPVAWSTFMTGVNPGKHNIFDFLRRDPKTYLPALSSAEINTSGRSIKIGPLRIPVGKPTIRMLRKSVPFWKILGEHGVFSVILKVPITFPPEDHRGLLLSGLCTPDLKGSQGTFTYYTTAESSGSELTSGYYCRLEGEGPVYETEISGPPDPRRPGKELTVDLKIEIDRPAGRVKLEVEKEKLELPVGVLSPWVPVSFRAGLTGRVRGITQFFLKSLDPQVELYLSPVQIDPEKPALPISSPFIYSIHLAKLFGRFATLGLPQDTWALNERVLTDDGFLQQAYGVHAKLEEIFFHSLKGLKKGLLCCVFDTTDVIQHEFWRYLEDDHPALNPADPPRPEVIEELYRKMDELVGKIRDRLKKRDLLLIVSDHGFKLFRRGVNVNTWLYRNGYLALKDGKTTSGEWYRDVDWSKTRAYAFGLSGVYLNLKGREQAGIVNPEDAGALKRELIGKLIALKDPGWENRRPLAAVYDTAEIYTGPYKNNAPDLILGFYPGWRHSWESVSGKVEEEVIIDNQKAWSADHCIDHLHVPGVFFSSRPIGEGEISLADLAPTALNLFGVRPPGYMDGKPLEFMEKS